ncbi:MAG: PIN domain-containing protein [Candidatus Dormiibacterota bacterium]
MILDTGPLLAAIHVRDGDHAACVQLLSQRRERFVVPAPVVVELDWLVRTRLGSNAFDAILADVESGGLVVEELHPVDYSRIRDLCQQYDDLNLGFVDAAVVAVAERLHEPRIATLDHRHFSVIRPAAGGAFQLLP